MYIRTEDGIYKVEGETCNKQGYYIDRYKEDVILKEQVIKQSENLEELCDMFVIMFECLNESYQGILESSYDKIKNIIQTLRIYEEVVYGAIWTYKGLIFVATMNDEGDLELI